MVVRRQRTFFLPLPSTKRLLIDGRRSGHRARGKNRQSEGGRKKRLLHGHYPLRILNGDAGHEDGLSRLLGRIRGAPKRARISAVWMKVQHGVVELTRQGGLKWNLTQLPDAARSRNLAPAIISSRWAYG